MTESQIHTHDRAFDFLKINERPAKPRSRGVTEIRGPYYTPMGKHYLQDVLETMGAYVDVLKFAAGSFSLMPRKAVQELLDLCHSHNVLVSTGGFIEHVLTQGRTRSVATLTNASGSDSTSWKSPPASSRSRLTIGCAWWRKCKRRA
jgi:hypothetical protein